MNKTGEQKGRTASNRTKTPWQRFSFLGYNDSFLNTAILLTAIALLLRLFRLGAFELWLDEAYTYRQAVIADWLGNLLRDNSPPFYNLMMRAWVGLFGASEASLRMPSALLGALFVLVACYAGREFFGRRAGLWSGLIAALSPIHVYYSREARNYSLLTLLLLLTALFLVRAVGDGRRRNWLLATACALLALYTHYLAALALLPMVALVLAWSPPQERRRNLKRFLWHTAAVLFIFFPWWLWSFVLVEHSLTGFGWMKAIWENLPPALAIPRTLEAFSFVTGYHLLLTKTEYDPQLSLLPAGLYLPARVFLAALFLWVVIPLGDRKLAIPALGGKKAALLAWFLVPLALLWGISFFRPLYIVSRYDMMAYPPFVLLFGMAFAKTQQAAGRLLLCFSVCCWFFASAWILYKFNDYPADTYKRDTAQQLISNVRPGDVVVFSGNRSYTTRYYLEQAGLECRNWRCTWPDGSTFHYRKYPIANEDEEAVYNDEEVLSDPQEVSRELDEFLATRQDRGATLWIALKGNLLENNVPEFFYLPDILLFKELRRRKLPCKLVAPELLLFACHD